MTTTGYPDRAASIYKDKMPSWVKSDKELKKTYQSGLVTFGQFCGACHQPSGKGLENVAPALVKSDWVNRDPETLIAVALHGLMGPIKVNGKSVNDVPPIMPPHMFLTDEQLAEVLTYVRNAWGNHAEAVTPDQVQTFRSVHKDRFSPWTEAELRGDDAPGSRSR